MSSVPETLSSPVRTRRFVHPLSECVYEVHERDRVSVTDAKTGRAGVFNAKGQWISGTLKEADPFICMWLEHKSGEAAFRNPLAGV